MWKFLNRTQAKPMEIEEKVFNNKDLNLKSLSKYNIQIEATQFSNTLNYDYSIKINR